MKRPLIYTYMLVFVLAAQAQNSPYISRVIEYRPAPGQHINSLFPPAEMSNTPEDALRFAEEALVGNASILGLGSFGGYVVVGFDHPIVNVRGEYDFKGLGNSSVNGAEPGIVMVCQDLNKNGVPDEDEPWYELAGSEYNHSGTIKNYEITYYRPNPDKQKSDVRWTDNQGNEGSVKHVSFATQATIYPLWISENTMTFKGTKLRNNVIQNGSIFQLPAFEWGYIDNNVNDDPIEKNGFKIDWAVDADGNPVDLAYIDFIKIYTSQVQEAGWLGETSTDAGGIVDLHPEATITGLYPNVAHQPGMDIYITEGLLTVKNIGQVSQIAIYSLQGTLLKHTANTNKIELAGIPAGVYILSVKNTDNKMFSQKIINPNKHILK